jgi:hypothetical protein
MRVLCVLVSASLIFLLASSIQHPASSIEYLEYVFELTAELTDHKDSVHSVAFSSDGRFMASGSADSNAKLWDADSGNRIKAIMRHPSPILCVSFSPDSNILAAGSEAGTITLWDVNYKERIKTLKGHEDRVWSIRFSPDGTLLASGSADNTIGLWDMGSGKEVRKLDGHTDSVYSLFFSPGGETLASGSADGTIRIWDVGSGKDILTLEESTGAVNSIAFSPDGSTLASGSANGTIWLWDLGSPSARKEARTFKDGHKDAIGINDCLSFSSDGKALVSGSSDGRILVWDVSSGNIVSELKAHKTAVNSIAFKPDGTRMASAGSDGVVKLWKVRVTESLGVTLDAEYEGWQRGTLKLKADVLGLADVVRFQYSLDSSTWLDIVEVGELPYSVDWNTRSSIPGVSEGIRLRVIAEKTAGATAMDIADGSFSVDNEPPSTEHDYDGLWHKADFDINLSADDGSGIGLSTTIYRLNYGSEKDARWDGQPRITREEVNTLEYWSLDKLGNEEAHKVLSDVKLDKAAPVFSDWMKEPESLTEGIVGPFRVSVRVTDEAGSGLAGKIPQFDYHIGSDTAYDGYEDMSGEDKQPPVSPFDKGDFWRYDIPEPLEGWDHYLGESIYYRAKCEDAAGNVGESAEQQELIGSTKTPPTVKMTTAFRDWERGSLLIKAEASDVDGVIKDVKFEYSFDNVAWTPIGAGTAPPYSAEWDTTADIPEVARIVWVRVTATDNDGLSAEYVTPSLGIDNQPPVTNHDYDGLWHKGDFTINLTADDGDGSGISSIKCKLNDGYERDISTDGQPKIYEQGKNTLEYWSVDVAGNEEDHKVLSDVKLDRLPPFFEGWNVKRDDSILHVEVKVVDADSGLGSAPEFDYHIGSDTSYSGYREMEKIDDDPQLNRGWKYDIDISSYLPGAIGKTVFCKVSAKDAMGNLGIRMWEHEITGPSTVEPTRRVVPTEPAPEESFDIKPVPVVESKGKRSSIVWTSGAASGIVNVGDKVEVQGRLEPKMDRSVPLDLTVIAPNDTFYVSRMDTDLSGAFEFSVPLTAEGQWKILADWQGDGEYEAAKSKVLTFQVISEESGIDTSGGQTAQKAGKFLKKNTIIIGLIFLYILVIRLYRS